MDSITLQFWNSLCWDSSMERCQVSVRVYVENGPSIIISGSRYRICAATLTTPYGFDVSPRATVSSFDLIHTF